MISINITDSPNDLSPILNSPVWFKLESASYSLTNFKYVVRLNYEPEPFIDVYENLNIYKLPPRPFGEALYTPNKMLSSYFGYKPQPLIDNWSPVDNALIKYNISYGFEYTPNINFIGSFNSGGFLGLSFSSQPDIVIGDVIRINKTNKQVNIGYDGLSTVTATGSNSIITNLSFGTTQSDETGTITSLLRINATSSSYECFYGTRQYDEVDYDFSSEYIVGSTNSSFFLTENVQDYKPVLSTDYETLSVILGSTQGYTAYINKLDVSGNVTGTHSKTISATNSYKRIDYGVGPMNIISDTGSASFFVGYDRYKVYIVDDYSLNLYYDDGSVSDIDITNTGMYNGAPYYTFGTYFMWWSSVNSWWEVTNALGGGNQYLISTTGSISIPPVGDFGVIWTVGADGPLFTTYSVVETGVLRTEEKKYIIKDYCLSDENFRLCFLNRLGGYDYFNFRLGGKKTINIERNEYKKVLPYNYSIGDRQDTTYNQRADEMWSIQSDWITDSESEWLNQLIESREVYHLKDGKLLPIQIMDKSYQVKTVNRDQIFNITLQFKYAFNKVI